MQTNALFDELLNRRFLQNLWPIPATNQAAMGTLALPFELLDATTGRKARLADYVSSNVGSADSSPNSYQPNRAVLLAFTRIFTEKQYCPLCYPHILELNAAYEQFMQRGIAVLMIASTDLRQSQIVQRDLNLKMPLLSDPSCQVFRRYQLGQALGAPLPAQFLVDQLSRIRFRHLFSFIEPNASVTRLLSAVDNLD